MSMTLEMVEKLERERAAAQAAADYAMNRRNAAVVELLESGQYRNNEVARALGVSPARVGQIADRARRQRDELAAA